MHAYSWNQSGLMHESVMFGALTVFVKGAVHGHSRTLSEEEVPYICYRTVRYGC